MEEPEQEREDGTESSQGRGAGGATPPRLAGWPPSPRRPQRRRRGRFTGEARGPPLLPQPPARPRPPPPAAAAATAVPCPPRPPRLSLRAAGDQRPLLTRRSTANRRRSRDTSHSAELEGDASSTSRGARTPPASARTRPLVIRAEEPASGSLKARGPASPRPSRCKPRPIRKSERTP